MSRENEDARRVAVEAALAELLARDTQYRKELKAHLETRLQNAEARRTMLIGIITKVRTHGIRNLLRRNLLMRSLLSRILLRQELIEP